jgi:hypothetical protein
MGKHVKEGRRVDLEKKKKKKRRSGREREVVYILLEMKGGKWLGRYEVGKWVGMKGEKWVGMKGGK